jgi:hypothetical protein
MSPTKRPPSRTARWETAVANAKDALSALESALEELGEVHQEYSDWNDNLPENLQQSAVGEKLAAMAEIDVDGALESLEEISTTLDECEGADLPLGFGRD